MNLCLGSCLKKRSTDFRNYNLLRVTRTKAGLFHKPFRLQIINS